MKPERMILHIPHSSFTIPAKVRKTFLLSEDELARELLRITDAYTDQLFTALTTDFALPLIYPVSRLVVDPERFPDDSQESMAKHGQGVIYTSTQDGLALRKPPDPKERENLLQAYYYRHHRLLTDMVKGQLAQAGCCLIIDCHSFPEVPFPFEKQKERLRPEICIGTDTFHTPARLSGLAANLFLAAGYTVEFNHPFSGALVPMSYYKTNPRVLSLMIEINRKCYMNEQTGEKNPGFPVLQQKLAHILKQLQATYFTP